MSYQPAAMKLAALCLVLTAGCAISPTPIGDEAQDSSATQYVNIEDFGSIDQGAWFDAIGKLNSEFAALCPTTFCTTGGYASYTPLTFYCSVSSKQGSVKDCAWTFAAANAAVDANTAAIAFDVPTFQCHIHPKTTATKLVAQLQGSTDALHEVLPGTTSIYDTLAACFADPIGATPIAAATSATPTYVDANDYYTTAANRAKWTASYAELQSGFDNVCGDTFCSSDYADLWSMQLACAVTKSTGNIKGCTWAFAGSFTTVAATGELALTSKSWQCPVAVKGTISEMIAALTSTTDTDDGVHRVLPGGTDAYDSIAGCLP
jgi:hypothetical protein